jgi:hypothetical protein
VVDDDQLGAGRDCPLEQLAVGGHAGGHGADLGRAGNL